MNLGTTIDQGPMGRRYDVGWTATALRRTEALAAKTKVQYPLPAAFA
jgi:hypothetical protein